MSWRWGVDWVCGISSLILKRQPSAGWNKEGGMIGLCGRHRASLKSICVPVSDHKRQALQESSSLSVCVCVGGVLCFLPSVCMIPLCVCRHALVPAQKLSLASYFIWPFFTFFPSFQADLFQHRFPPSPFFRSILPILSRGFPGCIWLTSGLVWSSKKPCCYHLQMNPSMCQCLYGNSVGHKMLSSTGRDVGSHKCEKKEGKWEEVERK